MKSDLSVTGEGTVSAFRSECFEQPQQLRALFGAYTEPDTQSQIAAFIKMLPPSLPVLWLGMGASWCSSYAAASWLSLLGRASFTSEASEWLHYAIHVRDQVAGPILVTTSGASAELVALTKHYGSGVPILLCNDPKSPCWLSAGIRFPILAGLERANATKSYINSVAASTILGSEVVGKAWEPEADRIVMALDISLQRIFERRQEIEDFSRPAASIEVIGRGPSFASAAMGALCIREMTCIRASAHSGGGFRHGPLLDVDSSHMAIILAVGRAAELGLSLTKDCLARGGRVVLVHSGCGSFDTSGHLLPLPLEPVPEPWESITSVLVSQALTLAMIERTGTSYVRTATTIE